MLRNENLINFVEDIKKTFMEYVAEHDTLQAIPAFSWRAIESSKIPEHRKTNIANILIFCQVAIFETQSIISLSKTIKGELEKHWYTGSLLRTSGNSVLRDKLILLLDEYLSKLDEINTLLNNSVHELNSNVAELKEVIRENEILIDELHDQLKEAYDENDELQNKVDLLEHKIQNQVTSTMNAKPTTIYDNNRLFKLYTQNSNEEKLKLANVKADVKIATLR